MFTLRPGDDSLAGCCEFFQLTDFVCRGDLRGEVPSPAADEVGERSSMAGERSSPANVEAWESASVGLCDPFLGEREGRGEQDLGVLGTEEARGPPLLSGGPMTTTDGA